MTNALDLITRPFIFLPQDSNQTQYVRVGDEHHSSFS